MQNTHFETYLLALEACAERQGILGKECVVHPPEPDYGYAATPRNSVTIGAMGVDGVHYVILTTDGTVRADSPVIQVCPMDFSDLYQVLAESFLSFLAQGCGVSNHVMDSVFNRERHGELALVPFLKSHFDMSRLWNEKRTRKLVEYLALIEQKPEML